jgi:hypothetical protein
MFMHVKSYFIMFNYKLGGKYKKKKIPVSLNRKSSY